MFRDEQSSGDEKAGVPGMGREAFRGWEERSSGDWGGRLSRDGKNSIPAPGEAGMVAIGKAGVPPSPYFPHGWKREASRTRFTARKKAGGRVRGLHSGCALLITQSQRSAHPPTVKIPHPLPLGPPQERWLLWDLRGFKVGGLEMP